MDYYYSLFVNQFKRLKGENHIEHNNDISVEIYFMIERFIEKILYLKKEAVRKIEQSNVLFSAKHKDQKLMEKVL